MTSVLYLLSTAFVALVCEVRCVSISYIKGEARKDLDDTTKIATELIIESITLERRQYRTICRALLVVHLVIFIIDKIVVYLK